MKYPFKNTCFLIPHLPFWSKKYVPEKVFMNMEVVLSNKSPRVICVYSKKYKGAPKNL